MKIKILGCGSSYGVPSLSRGYGECNPDNPKNTRLRSSFLLVDNKTTILFDTGPDIRQQLLSVGSPRLDAIVYTHAHYDHMGGANELASALADVHVSLPVYLSAPDASELRKNLSFVFQEKKRTIFDLHIAQSGKPFLVNQTVITPIAQRHGTGPSTGYRIGNFAYSTDVHDMDESSFRLLEGIDTWVMGVVSPRENDKHLYVARALEWIRRIRPRRAFFTHMGMRMDYDRLCATLPPHVRPVYDGLELEV